MNPFELPEMNPRELVDHIRNGPAKLVLNKPRFVFVVEFQILRMVIPIFIFAFLPTQIPLSR